MQKNKKAIIVISSVFFAGLIIVFIISRSVNALFLIAEGLDRPSRAYYILMERIYRLSSNKKIADEIWGYIENNKNAHLHNLYIHVLGITNADIPTGSLIKLYSQCQHDMNRRSTVSKIIDAMGLLGNERFVPFLETLLRDHDKLQVQATKYAIVRSLYLITGNRYAYINDLGKETRLQVSEELSEARNVIADTKGRSRNIREMLVLDRLYRPPGW